MRNRDLIALLQQDDPDADVTVVDSRNQEVSYDFNVCSQAQGTHEIPVGLILLLPKLNSPLRSLG